MLLWSDTGARMRRIGVLAARPGRFLGRTLRTLDALPRACARPDVASSVITSRLYRQKIFIFL